MRITFTIGLRSEKKVFANYARDASFVDVCQLLANCWGSSGSSHWVFLLQTLRLLGALHGLNKAYFSLPIAQHYECAGRSSPNDVRNYAFPKYVRSEFDIQNPETEISSRKIQILNDGLRESVRIEFLKVAIVRYNNDIACFFFWTWQKQSKRNFNNNQVNLTTSGFIAARIEKSRSDHCCAEKLSISIGVCLKQRLYYLRRALT